MLIVALAADTALILRRHADPVPFRHVAQFVAKIAKGRATPFLISLGNVALAALLLV